MDTCKDHKIVSVIENKTKFIQNKWPIEVFNFKIKYAQITSDAKQNEEKKQLRALVDRFD